MRLDRLITLAAVRPLRILVRKSCRLLPFAPRSLPRVLPILMYHSISDDPEPGVHPYYRLCTTPRRFAEQMRWLADNGYRGVTLTEGLAWLSELSAEIENPKSKIQYLQPVALTFDDGFYDFYTDAFPVLQESGFSATMYLPTAFIGDTRRMFSPSTVLSRSVLGPRSSILRPRPCLTWSEVHELHAAGIEFGSHTASHPRLGDQCWDEIESEIQIPKSEIEGRLSADVTAFAYPYAFPHADGEFVRRFCNLLRDVGYETNVTTQIGSVRVADDLLQLRRLPINDADDQSLFLAKLAGAYDWLGGLQTLSKRHRFKYLRRRKGRDNCPGELQSKASNPARAVISSS